MTTPYDLLTKTSKIKEFEWGDHYDFPRDLVGYSENSFDRKWPGGAKISVSFVINHDEDNLLNFNLLFTLTYL